MKKKTSRLKKNNRRKVLFLIILIIIVFMSVKLKVFSKDNKIDKCIVIDAGHGGVEEPGCIFNNIYEKDICLQIAKKLEDKLKKKYKTVIMTRTTDINVSLKARPEIANKKKADIFVSIHQNALEDDDITNGVETWYHPTKDTESKVLAHMIQEGVTRVYRCKEFRNKTKR